MASCFPFNLCGGGGSDDGGPPRWAQGYVSEWDHGRHEPNHRTAQPGRPALREGQRTRRFNPGPNPSVPSASGQPMAWTPASAGGASFFGAAPAANQAWAFGTPSASFVPGPGHATPAQWGPDGLMDATPHTRRTAMAGATPATFVAHLQPPPDEGPVIPVGNNVVFPQHLPPGAIVNGIVDPNDPGAIWVDHPAPGPHTHGAVHTGHDFQFTTGQHVPRGVPPVFTPGAIPMPPGVSNITPAQTFGVSPWAAGVPPVVPAAVTPAAMPAMFATPAMMPGAFATPAMAAVPVGMPAMAAVPAIPAVPAVAAAVAAPAWGLATPASMASPPDWLQSSTPEVALIPTLGLNPIEPSYPHLKWDLAQMPSAATVKHITGRVLVKQITPKEFREVALYPPQLDMYITLGNIPAAAQLHAQWGPIVVRHNKKGDITVGDVLDAVHAFFQERLTFIDFEAFKHWLGSPGDPNFKALSKGFYRRIRAASGLFEVEKQQGFKRIDFLGDNRRWCGLCRAPPSGPGDQTVSFQLYLQPTRMA